MTKADSAAANIASGKMNCSQSVLTAFCEEVGLEPALAIKLAQGFGGGMGGTGKTCGAVTGAYMVIGLKQDVRPENARQIKEKVNFLVKEFNRKFTEKNLSTTCVDLLGCDINSLEGRKMAKDKGLFASLCPQLVHDAVEMLETMD